MSLLGIVNYSDDDSSSDEAPVTINNNLKNSNQKISKPSPVSIKKKAPTPPPPEAIAQQKIEESNRREETSKPSNNTSDVINDRKVRLLQALTPKPIKDVKNWGIQDEPVTPCDPDRAEQIAHFLSLRRSGQRLNDHLSRNKSFRNPRIYTKLVEFTEVDEFGSNFEKEDFDPYGFPKELYIDGILETQKRLAEEKVASQQNRSSVQFVSTGGVSGGGLTQQQSSAMEKAMATAAKVASRIAKPPVHLSPPKQDNGKRRRDGDADRNLHKKRHH
ncbi:HCNGP-domain-containing protein [Backusella circina FSU 941]|nr:HCNGP-domain-containing protein [Backusella circina FSU 941]